MARIRTYVQAGAAAAVAIGAIGAALPGDLAAYAVETAQKGLKSVSLLRGRIKTDAAFSNEVYDRQENPTGRERAILRGRLNDTIKDGAATVGGFGLVKQFAEKTNTDGLFPLLSRFPSQHESDDFGERLVLQHAALGAVLPLASWATAYVEGFYTDVAYPGQDDFQIRQAYLLFGDLSKSPFYGLIGKASVDFGDFTSFTPYTHSHNAHYFWAESDDPVALVGYDDGAWRASATLIPSGRGLRTINTPDDEGFDNFAVNVARTWAWSDAVWTTVGAGYLHSTIYDAIGPHHPPAVGVDKTRNAAIDVFARGQIRNWEWMGEYSRTLEDWPATDVPVEAWTLQGRYTTKLFDSPTRFSAMFSRGIQGAAGTEWERMDQFILGAETQPLANLRIGLEYVRNEGFAPLINIQNTSNRDVESDTLILGAKIAF